MGKSLSPDDLAMDATNIANMLLGAQMVMAETSFITAEGKRVREMDAAFGIVTGAVQLLKKLADDIEDLPRAG